MKIQNIRAKFEMGQMDLSEIKWLIETVERLQNCNDTTNQDGKQLKETIDRQQNEIKELQEEVKELRQKICKFHRKTRFQVYEENLRLSRELAELKGELPG